MEDIKLAQSSELHALASPLRQRLMTALNRPASAVELARQFGMSRQRVGYHMRALEREGLIETVKQRAVRGCTEKIYRTRAVTYVLEPHIADHPQTLAKLKDRYSWAALVQLIGRALRDLSRLRRGADASGKQLATLSLQADITLANPAARQAFCRDLVAALQDTISQHQAVDGKGRRFRLMLGAYPTPKPREKHSHGQ